MSLSIVRIRTFYVACGVMLIALGARADLPGEVLPNRSFEEMRSATQLSGWGMHAFKTKAQFAVDRDVAHSGKASARLSGQTNKDRAGVTRRLDGKAIAPDCLYVLSAWVKIAGTSTHQFRTSARIVCVDHDGTSIHNQMFLCDPGPTDWRRQEWLFRIPPTTKFFNLTLFHHGQGTTWWDDVSLRVVATVAPKEPAMNAVVSDGRPRFAWDAEARKGARLEVAPEGDFGKALVYEVSGSSFTPPEPLPRPHNYTWRVSGVGKDGAAFVTATEQRVGKKKDIRILLPAFYAGTVEDRKAALRARFAGYREKLDRLRAFAHRNAMWDDFSLLGDALDRVEQLGTAPSTTEALEQVDSAWKELGYTLPWWELVFLDEEGFFNDLRLDMPGMEKVKAAADAKDWEKAKAELLAYYRASKRPSYYGKYGKTPTWPQGDLAKDPRADQIVAHRYSIYSYKSPFYEFGPDIDWHVYPIQDVSWCSRLHRHQHWKYLSAAYWRTGNDKYAAELVQQIFDWGKDNPMEEWDRHRYRWAWSTLNAGVRLYHSWIEMWMRVHDSPAWTPDAQYIFMALARENGRYLMRRAAKTGNWVLAEAHGLAELGIMFPEFKEAETWRNDAFKRLLREVDIQVLPDGVHMERTPGYHGMSLSCFMKPVQLALLNGIEVEGRDRFIRALEGMHQFYMYFSKPNLRTPQLGDADMVHVTGWLSRGYNTFRREDFQWVATKGNEGRPPVEVSHAFPDAGIYTSRSKWNDPQALFSMIDWGDAGSFHCDNDIGHVSLYAYGADQLVDAGRYSYDGELRKPFDHTSGHNTVMVDDKTQKRRDPLASDWVSTAQFDVFQGVTDNTEPLMFERTLAFRKPCGESAGYWLVVDRLWPDAKNKKSGGKHRIAQRWRATEKLPASIDGTVVTLAPAEGTKNHPALVIASAPSPGLAARVEKGPLSYKWYKKIETDVVEYAVERDGPVVLACALYPTADGVPAKVRTERINATLDGKAAGEGEVTALRVRIGEGGATREDVWVLNHTGKGMAAAGIETDARVAMVRRGGGAWMLTHGKTLRDGGKALFEAPEAVDGAGRVGDASVDTRTDPKPGAPPRDDKPMQFEIEVEEEREATSRPRALPKEWTPGKDAILFEAEDRTAEGGGTVAITTTKVASSGGKAFWHWDSKGHWVEWNAEVPRAGRYRVAVRVCSTAAAIQRSLSIDGETPKACEVIEFGGTGGFSNRTDDWRVFELTDEKAAPLVLDLKAGPHKIRMENIDDTSMNMDWLALIPAR